MRYVRGTQLGLGSSGELGSLCLRLGCGHPIEKQLVIAPHPDAATRYHEGFKPGGTISSAGAHYPNCDSC